MRGAAFRLPWPTSSNRRLVPIHRGQRWTMDPKYRACVERYAKLLLVIGVPRLKLAEPLRLDIVACPPDRRVRDLSNLIKVVEDALVKHELLADDRWVHDLRLSWGVVVRAGELRVRVQTIGPGIDRDAGPGSAPLLDPIETLLPPDPPKR